MAIRISTGTRDQAMGGSSSYKDMFDGGTLKIYTGGQPTNADATETGSELVSITAKFGSAASGALPVGSTAWAGTVSLAGIAGWWRLYGTGGTSGSSSTAIRIDGNCGVSGADLNFTNTSLRLAAAVTIDEFTITQPAS